MTRHGGWWTEWRNAPDRETGQRLGLVSGRATDARRTESAREQLGVHAGTAGAEDHDRLARAQEDERLHDPLHVGSDLPRRVLGCARRRRETLHRQIHPARAGVGADARDVGVVRGQCQRCVTKRRTRPGRRPIIAEAA